MTWFTRSSIGAALEVLALRLGDPLDRGEGDVADDLGLRLARALLLLGLLEEEGRDRRATDDEGERARVAGRPG